MELEDVKAAIESKLAESENRVRNKNAFQALFGAVSDPVGSLGKIFFGGSDAVDAERQRLQQDAVLELLCRIDQAISDTASKAVSEGIDIAGLIETTADGGDSVVGVDIAEDSGPVRFRPGTHIRTSSVGAKSTTGLKIGSRSEE